MNELGAHLQQDVSKQNVVSKLKQMFHTAFQKKVFFLFVFYGRNLAFVDWNSDCFLQGL